MIIDLIYFVQVANAASNTTNTIIAGVGTFLGGSAFTAIVNGFFDVKRIEEVSNLRGQIQLLERDNQYLKEELIEKSEEIQQLREKNSILEEAQTSGFSLRMSDLEQEISRLRSKNQELVNRLKKRPNQG